MGLTRAFRRCAHRPPPRAQDPGRGGAHEQIVPMLAAASRTRARVARAPPSGCSTAARSHSVERARRRGGRLRRRRFFSNRPWQLLRCGRRNWGERATNELGFGGRRSSPFCSGGIAGQPSNLIRRSATVGGWRAGFGPGERRRQAEFAAQAQVAAWARGGARCAEWALGRFRSRAERTLQIEFSFFFSKSNFEFRFD